MQHRLYTLLLYGAILPAILLAAAFLGYHTWHTARQAEKLGERTIVQSTLLLALEKVDRIEQQIIRADHAVFDSFDPNHPERWAHAWRRYGYRDTPSVRSVLVLDNHGEVQGLAHRGSAPSRARFLANFFQHVLIHIETQHPRSHKLQHLHTRMHQRSHLFSWQRRSLHPHQRYLLVLEHDPRYFLSQTFPRLFRSESDQQLYNIVDEDNRRIFGPSLTKAGDYLVGHRFPTTLYGWRLQVAPRQAPLLEAQGKSRRLNEAALPVASFVVIMLGMAFLLYANQKQRKLSALKSDFVANVSHELKTPLAALRMFSELLLEGKALTASKRQHYLEIMAGEAQRLSALIDNVLDFAALERGKATYHFRSADLEQFTLTAVAKIKARLTDNAIPITVHCEGDKRAVRFDGQSLTLALTNLIDNALKYGHRQPVQVHLSFHQRHVTLSVRDQGPGIATADLHRVFDRFYRACGSHTVRGSGIGLALVKSIAEAHGGRVFAHNCSPKGADIGMHMPLHRRAHRSGMTPSQAESRVSVHDPAAAV